MRRVCTGLGAREKLDSPLGPCDGSSVVHGLREHDQRARSAHSGPSLHLGSAYAPTPPGVAPRLSDRSPPRSGGLGWLPVMPVEMDPILVGGDIRLDTARRFASRAGRRLELSAKELAVLEVLLAADGAPVSTGELLRRAWDQYASPHSNVVKVTMLRLRRKLGDPPVIETVPHLGYRICP